MGQMPVFDADEVKEQIIELERGFEGSYEELMEGYRRMLSWAKSKLRDDSEIQERIREIKRKSLRISIRAISNGEPLYHSYISRKYPYIEGVAKRSYFKEDGKTALQVAIEDAGVRYYQRHKFRNLKQLLEDIAEIGDEPEDFTTEYFYEIDQGLGKVIKSRFGTIGKGVMLVGINYPGKRNSSVRTKRYSFSPNEFKMVLGDESLEDGEKVAVVFNMLCLQYYPLEGYGSKVERGPVNRVELFTQILEDNRVLNDKVSVYLGASEREDKYVVGLYLAESVQNIFSLVRVREFYFHNGFEDAVDFYDGLEGRCNGLEVVRVDNFK